MSKKPHKHNDLSLYHGHRVVTGDELGEAFGGDPDNLRSETRYRGRVRHGIVVALLLAIVIFGAGAAWALLNGYISLPNPASASSPAAPSACPTEDLAYGDPQQIEVRILNATGTPGLARTTAEELGARGFKRLPVGNSEQEVTGTAIIVSGVEGQQAALTLQRHLPGSLYAYDPDGGAQLRVTLGAAFKGLTKADAVKREPGRLACVSSAKAP